MILATAFLAASIALHPVASFPLGSNPLAITRSVHSGAPFNVAGEHGAILGEQDGHFEAWIWPVKVLSQFQIYAEMSDHQVPIDVNALAATIEVAPGRTSITYSHAAFTIRQHMVAFRNPGSNEGAAVFFEIASVRPLRLTFRFMPEIIRMWPAANFGPPSADWKPEGYYVLHTDNPEISAAIGIPRAQPGPIPSNQEKPRAYPLEFQLSFDPKKDSKLFFPLLMTVGSGDSGKRLQELNERLPGLVMQTQHYYDRFWDDRTTAETPDLLFNQALKWAEIAIDQGRVNFHGEEGLVAGYCESGDSARPGYGWFFGRDALWSSYALNSFGDFAVARNAIKFLIKRQRDDGKIMHEFSQTADLVDWKSLPYLYAAADSTPLFVMAMEDYVNASGDISFLQEQWNAVKKAYSFTRSHVGPNGIYTNTEGTGWVESWPPGMPYQEIYLASLDQQSSDSMARLAAIMHEDSLSRNAAETARRIRTKLESEFYVKETGFYAFSRDEAGRLDKTATIYPSVAWWNGRLFLPGAGPMLTRWASSEFSTDWGVRDVSIHSSIYDPISYHQGSVWPLFTGWVALAEYRAGRALAGYQHLMQNADLTWAQDPGAVTELLSGAFFQPLGRSSTHQVWSSAMVLIPALRGLFGLEWDAFKKTLRIAPHLPAEWDEARLHNVRVGSSRFDLIYRREGGRLIVREQGGELGNVCLAAGGETPKGCQRQLSFPLPGVEVALPHGLPLPGAFTGQLKAVDEQSSENRTTMTLEAPAASTYELTLRVNRSGVRVLGGELSGNRLHLQFPSGEGYQRLVLTFEW